jgi:two-component system sensor histidine kinase/response regulator
MSELPLPTVETLKVRTPVNGLQPSPCEVLIVDDMATLRLTLERHVVRMGHRATPAINGKEALLLLQSRRFDLVLLDLVMPEMDGYTVLDRIKADPYLRDIPVIMISGVDDMESVVRCIEAGAEDFLPKPFQAALLRARIRTSLEKKLLWDALDRRYKELQAAEKMRDSLTHMIVHDLRTPLTSLLLGIRTVALAGTLNPLQQECLDRGIGCGEALLGMVNDLLDISKLEAGQLSLDYSEVDVAASISDCVQRVAALIQDKALTVREEALPDRCALSADATMLHRVLLNLLGNAIKFTAPGGRITLRARPVETEAAVVFEVEDTGAGIPADAFVRIFEKFGQVGAGQAGSNLSTGLGLTFCKMVVEAHGGRIWVESLPGTGSTFYFTIPYNAPGKGEKSLGR